MSYWAGKSTYKAEFLRLKAVTNESFVGSFKDRGIYPINGRKALSRLSNVSDNIPDLVAPDLRSYGSRTLSLIFGVVYHGRKKGTDSLLLLRVPHQPRDSVETVKL